LLPKGRVDAEGGDAIILAFGRAGVGSGSRKGLLASCDSGSVGEPLVAVLFTKVFWAAAYDLLAGSLDDRIRDAASIPDMEGRESPFSKEGLGERTVVVEF
jgi:hypothetical protein